VIHLTNDESSYFARLEAKLWREETRFHRPRLDELIVEDFCELGRSGRVYREEDTPGMPRLPIDAVLPPPASGRDCSDETALKSVTTARTTAREPRWSLVL
jgi:hypothetical protein